MCLADSMMGNACQGLLECSDGLETKNGPGIFTHQRPTEVGCSRPHAHAISDTHKEQALLIAPMIVNVNSQVINNYTPIHKTH